MISLGATTLRPHNIQARCLTVSSTMCDSVLQRCEASGAVAPCCPLVKSLCDGEAHVHMSTHAKQGFHHRPQPCVSVSFSVLMPPFQSYDYIQIVQAAARSPLRAPAANML
jgi:hypothetical protein